MFVERLVRLLVALIGIRTVLTLLRERGLQRAVLAQQFVAVLLGVVALSLSVRQLTIFFCLLRRKLSGFGCLGRLVAPRVLKPAAHRAGLAFLEGVAQVRDTLAAYRATAFDEFQHAAIVALAVIEVLARGLALGD